MGARFLFFLLFFPFLLHAWSGEQENFVVLDGTTGEVLHQQGPGIDFRVTPACSFNIALSLMGFDTEILIDELEPVWTHEDEEATTFESETPLSWMQTSSFWFSQRLGSDVAFERMKHYLALFDYGNQDVSGGVTRAWVSSSLQISPHEQADFIFRLTRGELPVSPKAVTMTRALLYRGELPHGGAFYSKTGLGKRIEADGATWLVRSCSGWVEKEGYLYPFAYNLIAEELDWKVTVTRVKELMVRLLEG